MKIGMIHYVWEFKKCQVSSGHLQGFGPHANMKYNVVVLFLLFHFKKVFVVDFLWFEHSPNRETDFHG
jgi:hypothetical protein